jgi:SpoVK/Ycf46/Vps4 family AAA+-type ATPase
MNIPNLDTLLIRDSIAASIQEFLVDFEENKRDLTRKRGVYLCGDPGCGKTYFIKKLLKSINYDAVLFDAGDIRNKGVIDAMTRHNMSDTNIMSTLTKKKKPIAIIMDEIDGMNSGDKGGINALIKLIRPKKTKKQRNEEVANSPIICISNYHTDKKIKELMKVCIVFELPRIGVPQLHEIIRTVMPDINSQCKTYIANNIQGDMRRVATLHAIYSKCPKRVTIGMLKTVMFPKCCNDDTKQITTNLFSRPHSIEDHNIIMNETDRTIVGLLWHENVIDILQCIENKPSAIAIYLQFLANMCFSDYIDRITFQKQIWQFNELSSLMKTFYNSHILHNSTIQMSGHSALSVVRFTKVLTKYSTEYNNSTFIHNMCQQVGMDKKDMFLFFRSLSRDENSDCRTVLSDNYDITKLDISRIDRYLDKHVVDVVDPVVNSNTTCDVDGCELN